MWMWRLAYIRCDPLWQWDSLTKIPKMWTDEKKKDDCYSRPLCRTIQTTTYWEEIGWINVNDWDSYVKKTKLGSWKGRSA